MYDSENFVEKNLVHLVDLQGSCLCCCCLFVCYLHPGYNQENLWSSKYVPEYLPVAGDRKIRDVNNCFSQGIGLHWWELQWGEGKGKTRAKCISGCYRSSEK